MEEKETIEITENEKMKWYALYVMPNKERKTKEGIQRAIRESGLEDFVSNVEVPMEKYWTFVRDKKTLKERVMVPGYILIRADLNNGEVLPTLKAVKNVLSFVTAERKTAETRPSPLSKKEVDKFLNIVEENDAKEVYNFDIGDEVEVLEGAFSSFKGIIDVCNHDTKKMRVNIDIFGRATPVELEFIQVKKSI
jgi:transcriptional antiterminator NusG